MTLLVYLNTGRIETFSNVKCVSLSDYVKMEMIP